MSKKRWFFLKGFNPEETEKKYGLSIVSNIEKDVVISHNKTNILDVIEKMEESSISFLDEKYKTIITMTNWLTQSNLPQQTDIHCFWCKHSFKSKPIGCPIKFINHRIEKSYISHITKDRYYMKENITKVKLSKLLLHCKKDIDINPIEKEYYLTDGIFCSFNCTLAWINDNAKDPFYSESKTLLYTMYKECIGNELTKIKASPHWRLLKNFGGPFTIDEYRQAINIIEYEQSCVYMKTVHKMFTEK